MRACEPAHPWIVVAIQGFVGEEKLQFTVGSRRQRSCSPEPRGLPNVPVAPSASRDGAEGSKSWSKSRSKSRSVTTGEGAGTEETQPTDTPDVTLVLISRRQWRRAGTRYHHRGIDDHGMLRVVAYAHMLFNMQPFVICNPLSILVCLSNDGCAWQAMSRIM